MMAAIRSRDTKPELVVRKFLWARGWRFRVCDGKIPGHPDVVVPRARTLVEVRGCFWHRHGWAWAGRLGLGDIPMRIGGEPFRRDVGHVDGFAGTGFAPEDLAPAPDVFVLLFVDGVWAVRELHLAKVDDSVSFEYSAKSVGSNDIWPMILLSRARTIPPLSGAVAPRRRLPKM